MRITRLYLPEKLSCGYTIQLDSNTSSHLIRVLRTRINSPVILFNGDGYDYYCLTLDDNAKQTKVIIEKKVQTDAESPLSINLFQGLSKLDRMETTIQKSVELGVNKITPVLCSRSNLKFSPEKIIKKMVHWQKIATSACQQSGRNVIPKIENIISIDKLDQCMENKSLRLALDPEADTSIKKIGINQQTIEIFIGPEGGLTDIEIETLKNSQFKNIRFGPRILRTETAGPAVISALQVLHGDCG